MRPLLLLLAATFLLHSLLSQKFCFKMVRSIHHRGLRVKNLAIRVLERLTIRNRTTHDISLSTFVFQKKNPWQPISNFQPNTSSFSAQPAEVGGWQVVSFGRCLRSGEPQKRGFLKQHVVNVGDGWFFFPWKNQRKPKKGGEKKENKKHWGG